AAAGGGQAAGPRPCRPDPGEPGRSWRGEEEAQMSEEPAAEPAIETAGRPAIVITYCTQCSWMLRSAWMAQELLSTFSTELGSVALVPGTGGIFEIHFDGELVW